MGRAKEEVVRQLILEVQFRDDLSAPFASAMQAARSIAGNVSKELASTMMQVASAMDSANAAIDRTTASELEQVNAARLLIEAEDQLLKIHQQNAAIGPFK